LMLNLNNKLFVNLFTGTEVVGAMLAVGNWQPTHTQGSHHVCNFQSPCLKRTNT